MYHICAASSHFRVGATSSSHDLTSVHESDILLVSDIFVAEILWFLFLNHLFFSLVLVE